MKGGGGPGSPGPAAPSRSPGSSADLLRQLAPSDQPGRGDAEQHDHRGSRGRERAFRSTRRGARRCCSSRSTCSSPWMTSRRTSSLAPGPGPSPGAACWCCARRPVSRPRRCCGRPRPRHRRRSRRQNRRRRDAPAATRIGAGHGHRRRLTRDGHHRGWAGGRRARHHASHPGRPGPAHDPLLRRDLGVLGARVLALGHVNGTAADQRAAADAGAVFCQAHPDRHIAVFPIVGQAPPRACCRAVPLRRQARNKTLSAIAVNYPIACVTPFVALPLRPATALSHAGTPRHRWGGRL